MCIFSGSCVGLVCVIGQFFCASLWYMFSIVMMWSAALSIWVGVTVGEVVSLARYVDASSWALLVMASPSW